MDPRGSRTGIDWSESFTKIPITATARARSATSRSRVRICCRIPLCVLAFSPGIVTLNPPPPSKRTNARQDQYRKNPPHALCRVQWGIAETPQGPHHEDRQGDCTSGHGDIDNTLNVSPLSVHRGQRRSTVLKQCNLF